MNYIRSVRENAGMTQKDLAAAINVNPPTLGNWEAGRREPPIDMLCAIADVLDCSLDLLIRGKEKDRPVERSLSGAISILADLPLEDIRAFLRLATALQYDKERQERRE